MVGGNTKFIFKVFQIWGRCVCLFTDVGDCLPPNTNVVSTRHQRCSHQTPTLFPPNTNVVSTKHQRCSHQTPTLFSPKTNVVGTKHQRCSHQTPTFFPPNTQRCSHIYFYVLQYGEYHWCMLNLLMALVEWTIWSTR